MKVSHHLYRIARVIDQEFIIKKLQDWITAKDPLRNLIIEAKSSIDLRPQKTPKFSKLVNQNIIEKAKSLGNDPKEAKKNFDIWYRYMIAHNRNIDFETASANGYHFHVAVGMDPMDFYNQIKEEQKNFSANMSLLHEIVGIVNQLLILYQKFEIAAYQKELQELISIYKKIESETRKLSELDLTKIPQKYEKFENRLHIFETLFYSLETLMQEFKQLGNVLLPMEQQIQIAMKNIINDPHLQIPGDHINLRHIAEDFGITEAAAITAAKQIAGENPDLIYTEEHGPEIIRRKRF